MLLRIEKSPDRDVVLDQEGCAEALQRALELEGVREPVEITVLVTDDETIRSLNSRFRGIDAPTDVLSFPAEEQASQGAQPDHPFVTPPEDRHLGDIAVSYPRALRQAAERGWSVQEEIRFLLVHGLLHILGYDHATRRGQAAMARREAEILG
ncbi:MAG: rRNA maturation RNase YbeY [Anaerolineae bacterium]